METDEFLKLITDQFQFLIAEKFQITKKEKHWLGGVIVEYSNEQYCISILYDKREQWFTITLSSIKELNKTHFYFVIELGNHCKIPSSIVSMDDDKQINFFLSSVSKCLKDMFTTVLQKFNAGEYPGGHLSGQN